MLFEDAFDIRSVSFRIRQATAIAKAQAKRK
jgi:hypothetical protein